MEISFQTKKLEKTCNEQKLLERAFGEQAPLIRRRLDELRAADVLEHMRSLKGAECHELKGKRSGQLAVKLIHPYRLVFRPDHDPLPKKPDGGLDWSKVTRVIILKIEDYHGRKKAK